MPDRPWSGPKKIDRGWTTVAWQGWLPTAVFVAVILAVSMLPGPRHRLVPTPGLTGPCLLVVVLAGTRPGGNFRGGPVA